MLLEAAAVTHMGQKGAVQGVGVRENNVGVFFNIHSVIVSGVSVTGHCAHRQQLIALTAPSSTVSLTAYDCR